MVMTSWEFPAEGPGRAKIKIASGSVAVTAAPTDTVTVNIHTRNGHGEDLAGTTEVEYHAGQLTITGPKQSRLLGRAPSLHVAVAVPPGCACDIDTASADIRCSGELSSLTANTASGDVYAERVTGPSRAKSASGDIRLDQSGPAKVQTVSGDVAIGAAEGDVSGQTVSGDFNISSVASGEISVQTTSGDISVAVAAGTGVQLDLYTLSGDASSELEPEGQADAADATVKCRSVSGDVIVRRAV
jgi:DUF4097 and DUF4098 domain-containing protein YvlB